MTMKTAIDNIQLAAKAAKSLTKEYDSLDFAGWFDTILDENKRLGEKRTTTPRGKAKKEVEPTVMTVDETGKNITDKEVVVVKKESKAVKKEGLDVVKKRKVTPVTSDPLKVFGKDSDPYGKSKEKEEPKVEQTVIKVDSSDSTDDGTYPAEPYPAKKMFSPTPTHELRQKIVALFNGKGMTNPERKMIWYPILQEISGVPSLSKAPDCDLQKIHDAIVKALKGK